MSTVQNGACSQSKWEPTVIFVEIKGSQTVEKRFENLAVLFRHFADDVVLFMFVKVKEMTYFCVLGTSDEGTYRD